MSNPLPMLPTTDSPLSLSHHPALYATVSDDSVANRRVLVAVSTIRNRFELVAVFTYQSGEGEHGVPTTLSRDTPHALAPSVAADNRRVDLCLARQ